MDQCCARGCVHTSTNTYICTRRPEDNLGCGFSGARLSHWDLELAD